MSTDKALADLWGDGPTALHTPIPRDRYTPPQEAFAKHFQEYVLWPIARRISGDAELIGESQHHGVRVPSITAANEVVKDFRMKPHTEEFTVVVRHTRFKSIDAQYILIQLHDASRVPPVELYTQVVESVWKQSTNQQRDRRWSDYMAADPTALVIPPTWLNLSGETMISAKHHKLGMVHLRADHEFDSETGKHRIVVASQPGEWAGPDEIAVLEIAGVTLYAVAVTPEGSIPSNSMYLLVREEAI